MSVIKEWDHSSTSAFFRRDFQNSTGGKKGKKKQNKKTYIFWNCIYIKQLNQFALNKSIPFPPNGWEATVEKFKAKWKLLLRAVEEKGAHSKCRLTSRTLGLQQQYRWQKVKGWENSLWGEKTTCCDGLSTIPNVTAAKLQSCTNYASHCGHNNAQLCNECEKNGAADLPCPVKHTDIFISVYLSFSQNKIPSNSMRLHPFMKPTHSAKNSDFAQWWNYQRAKSFKACTTSVFRPSACDTDADAGKWSVKN